jgi:hypothetical protein
VLVLNDPPAWLGAYYACINGEADDHERPYRIPTRGRVKLFAGTKMTPNPAFVYSFVHVPMAAGSYFTEILSTHLGTPVTDLTEPHYRAVMRRYSNRSPPAPPRQPAQVFKGSLAMGFCDVVDAPCAYLTVLRDPVERLFSQYAYLCLQGSKVGWCRLTLGQGGQEESLVPPHTRGSVSLTGARAIAWCLLIHEDASPSLTLG